MDPVTPTVLSTPPPSPPSILTLQQILAPVRNMAAHVGGYKWVKDDYCIGASDHYVLCDDSDAAPCSTLRVELPL